MFTDILAVIAVLVVLTCLIGILKRWQTKANPHPEFVRKALHVGMGLVALSFPWIFHSALAVATLATLSGGGLALIKRVDSLRERFGSVFCAVKRNTWGEVSFAAAIAILFAIASNQPLLYCIPVLTLATADSVSALVGISFGKFKYTTMEGTKTLEGSLAFFVITALVTTLWLLFTGIDPAKASVIGVLIGGLVTMFEAASWKGLDNLFVPLSTYFLLVSYLPLDLPTLLTRLATGCLLLAFALGWRHFTRLNDAASMGAGLICYLCSAFGLNWVLAPLTVLVLHKFMLPDQFRTTERNHNVYSVIAVSAGGLLWMAAQSLTGKDFFFQYTAAYAINLSMIAIGHMRLNKPDLDNLPQLLKSSITSWALLFIPYLLTRGEGMQATIESLCALPLTVAAAGLFCLLGARENEKQSGKTRWFKQGSLAALASAPLSLL